MAIPVWAVGQVLSASDVNSWFIPIAAIKPAGTGRSGTAMSNDPDLTVAVAANATYEIGGLILYNGPSGAASDIKWTFSVPASTSGAYFFGHQNLSSSFAGSFPSNWGDTNTAQTQGQSGNTLNIAIIGVLATSTAGNVTFQWAQNTNSGTTTVQANSYLRLQRIG